MIFIDLEFYHLFKIFEFSFASSRMETVQVNLLNLGDKARSKYELYKMLTVEGHMYMPPYKYWSVDFMADIIEGKKRYARVIFPLFDLIQALKYKDVIIRHLPHVEGLRTENLLEFLINNCEGLDFLPAKYENINMYRDWVGNICMLIWFYNEWMNF